MVPMTQTNISKERKLQIKKAVLFVLQHGNIYELPVKIKSIARSFSNIRLISYSKHMKKTGISYEKMKVFTKTDDACTDYYADSNMYYIYYNDIDSNIVKVNRYRWNIAHELGHIFLNHHIANRKTRIFRCSLSSEEYNLLEREADYFAQLILVPHAALAGFKINNKQNIRYMCKISDSAAQRRYFDFIEWKSHINAKDEYDNRIFKFYYNFVFKRRCKKCDVGLIQRYGKYCSVCGSKNTLQWGDGEMKYPLLPTHENGKLKECTRCKNEETAVNGEFCQICGLLIVNKCSNYACSNKEVLPSNARYCPICGETSTFYNFKILNGWDYKPQVRNSYEMISIPDGIDEELPFN